MTENSPLAADSSLEAARHPKKRGFFAKLRLTILCIILLALIAVQAPIFPHVVRGILMLRAWQNGVTLSAREVAGNLFEPIVLRDVLWEYTSETGAVTRVEAARARATFAWSNVFPAPVSDWIRMGASALNFRPIAVNGAWFQELELDGITARVVLPKASEGSVRSATSIWLHRELGAFKVHPSTVTVRNADLILSRGDDYLRCSGTNFTLSEIEQRTFRANQIACRLNDARRVFHNVRGYTSLQDFNATVANLVLAPDVTITSLTIGIVEIAEGKLSLGVDMAAFGGKITAEANTMTEAGEIRFDSNGKFSTIKVAEFASFLGMSEATGGVLKQGSFSFRGSPRDFTKAQATVRLEAGAFQWDSRQWDSLVLGFSLVDQKLQIPEFQLKQGPNQLTVKGTMQLPSPNTRWWERPFDLKIDADIVNLTDLSALLLPEFKYAAGHLFIRGTVSGSGAEPNRPATYEGQMIFSGADLQWRTAPIDNLHAAVLFRDRELQVISAQLLRGDDFLRGSGRVSLADGSYTGEWRLTARDLGDYKAVLSPHLLPIPVSGGITATWAGKGNREAQEGNITARLSRFRVAGPGKSLPLDAEFSGAYHKGEVQLQNLRVAESGTVLTAGVIITPGSVGISNLKVQNQNRTWLQGSAALPLDAWQQWPNLNFTRLLNDKTPGRLQLEASELDLRAVSRLSGLDWPLAGVLTGSLNTEGTLAKLQLTGKAQLTDATLPLNWNGGTIRDVDASLAFEGKTLRVESVSGQFATGEFALNGTLDFQNARNPALIAEGIGTNGGTPFSFKAQGPAARPTVSTEGNAPFAASAPPAATPPATPATPAAPQATPPAAQPNPSAAQ